MKKILLVEDNELIVKGLKFLLEKDYLFDYALNKEEALKKCLNKYDLVILDVTLPDGNGFEIAKEIKYPILFLTAKDEEEDIIKGLNLGEDYITKPFKNNELLIRISKILSRYNNDYLYFKDIVVDNNKMKVYKDNLEIVITPLEYKIIYLLFSNIGKIITRDKILKLIWDDNMKFVCDNTLTVYIKRIREKLLVDYIKTVKGIGYIVDEN